ncbi:hypothetical protein LCGC14_1176270, partial [marine sediment metagenome]
MSNLWEYESKTLGGRRRGFLKAAQTSGFHKLVRSSLLSRGMDPDIIEGLTAPPSVTKPIERDTIKEIVPPTDVSNTQRSLQTRPRTTFIPPEERRTEKRGLSGGLLKAVGEVAGQAASDVLSILDVVDIPRREVGKPVARVILEPLAMTADLLNALSPANVPGIPSIRGVTRPPLTGGEIRGGTSVEILSYITDPLNLAFFAGPAIKAAKAATLGVRLGLKDAQALRKVTPLARRLMVEEAGGRALTRETGGAAAKIVRAEGSDLMLPEGYKRVAYIGKDVDPAYVKRVGGIDVNITRNSPRAEERMTLGGRELVRPDMEDGISVDIIRTQGVEKPLKALPEVLHEIYLIAKNNPELPVASNVTNEKLARLLERMGFVGKAEGTSGIKWFTFTPEKLAEVLGITGPDLVPVGAKLTGPEAARKLIGGDLPGTRALTLEEATPKLTKSVPVHESQEIKD